MEQVVVGLRGWGGGGEGALGASQRHVAVPKVSHVTPVSSGIPQFIPPDLLYARFGLHSHMEAA